MEWGLRSERNKESAFIYNVSGFLVRGDGVMGFRASGDQSFSDYELSYICDIAILAV